MYMSLPRHYSGSSMKMIQYSNSMSAVWMRMMNRTQKICSYHLYFGYIYWTKYTAP